MMDIISLTLLFLGITHRIVALTDNEVNSSDDDCPCPGAYKMNICGSDGVTYESECKLLCTKWKRKPDLQAKSLGRCPDPSHTYNGTAPCHCKIRDVAPVCGVDGNYTMTFISNCSLHCHIETADPNMKYLHDGDCSESQRAECDCPSKGNFVCGSDGITYTSLCELNCKAKKGTFIKHVGRC